MEDVGTLLIRLLLSILVGGLIGAEREYRSKFAGFRTMILICMGSYLFTTFGIYIAGSSNDRIASNIVTGIGFIGAGVIFQSENRINGLTTAATIWVVAALGMGIGAGQYALVSVGTLAILGCLFFLTKLEEGLDHVNQSRNYKITSVFTEDLVHEYENLFSRFHLRSKRLKQSKNGPHISGSWIVKGALKDHEDFIKHVLQDERVKEFEF
jgi:putative Mg2+ transporter-C (MgtC) family protein